MISINAMILAYLLIDLTWTDCPSCTAQEDKRRLREINIMGKSEEKEEEKETENENPFPPF